MGDDGPRCSNPHTANWDILKMLIVNSLNPGVSVVCPAFKCLQLALRAKFINSLK